MKNAQGFAWPLGSLRAMQEMRLAAEKTRLQDAVRECQAADTVLEQLVQVRSRQAQAPADGRYDLARHSSALLYLSHLGQRIAESQAQREAAQQRRLHASESCLRSTRSLEALEASRDKSLAQHTRQAEARLAREADTAWLARQTAEGEIP